MKDRQILGVGRTVFLLGIVSFLTDISSEMLVPIVPQFLAFVIGASRLRIGLIEGIAESTAALLRVWAGYMADRTGRPKLLTVVGYGLSAFSKPFYVFATAWSHVLAMRFADRFGKGIRSAPRDVLLADAAEEGARGRAFGFHRAMDTAGAAAGPLAVLLLVFMLTGSAVPSEMGPEYRRVYAAVFAAAAVPAVLGWLVLVLFVKERAARGPQAKKPEIRLTGLDTRYRVFLAIVTLFSIGNSSDAFLVLRATSSPIGMRLVEFLWVYVAFNVFSAFVSFRSGILSDRVGRRPVIVAGWFVFAVVYFAMARVSSPAGIWVWFIVYGAYSGMTEGMLRAYAIDLAPEHLRGTAAGIYHTFTGAALLPASLIAGLLWDSFGPSAPFYYGAATAFASALLLATLIRDQAV